MGRHDMGGSSPSPLSVQSWRTAFLTLRDETTFTAKSPPPPPPAVVIRLLNRHLTLFNSSVPAPHSSSSHQTLIAAVPYLPSHEVTSDLVFLMDLAATAAATDPPSAELEGEDHDNDFDEMMAHTFTQLCQFFYDVNVRVSLHINSSHRVHLLCSFERIMAFLGRSCGKKISSVDALLRAVKQSLDIIRSIVGDHQRNGSLLETMELMKFLLSIMTCFNVELFCPSSTPSGYQRDTAEFVKSMMRRNGLWELRSTFFTMIGDVFLRVGSSISFEIWQSTIEVLKKDMDILASSSTLVRDSVMARFYTSLLNCLHLVLVDPKGPLSNYVAGFVAALRMFFVYGISDRSQFLVPSDGYKKHCCAARPNSNMGRSDKSDSGRYRPPHLRKQASTDMQQLKSPGSPSSSDQEPCITSYTSSDSDFSDNDGPTIDAHGIHCSRARVAAIVCIQDLCRVDPKLFTGQWTMLLPSSDVLQPRMYEASLMTCLLFDPYLKARIASAAALIAMLDGPASVFLQVAEYKDSVKRGSFTSLSSSLGQILMQLHRGILFLTQHETHGGLLLSSFKILMLLISSTPYSRMPGDLLPTVISSLQAKVRGGFRQQSDQSNLLAIVINCMTAAISSTPSSPKVREMLRQEINQGIFEAQGEMGVLSSLFQYSDSTDNPTLSLEALQALRAVSHSYPDIVGLCWTHVSSTVRGLLGVNSSVPARTWRRNTGSVGEKVITAAVKALDECLRAISGFKGTEDFFDDKSFETPFTSDYTRTKRIYSAPFYGSESSKITKDESESCILGAKQWSEVLEMHLPLVLSHTSSMVRAASVTCFAGLTSSVFSSISKEKQQFVLSSTINAAVRDEAPSVRSAACRAIGVITWFPLISQSAEMLREFTHAIEFNTRDSLVLVRITASWALANICDSLRHFTDAATSGSCCMDSNESSLLIAVPLESALQMTKENDKIKANAVRALGNLSRFVRFTRQSGGLCFEMARCKGFPAISNSFEAFLARGDRQDIPNKELLEGSWWLGRMVQAFLSCVATGNVKVQWNVCHALGNLFANETVKLGDMDWAASVFTILLELLCNSPNFKIRIQAAAALAVPPTILDYGESFMDVIQGVEHAVENLSSEHLLPSSFKYRIALEKQLISTMLHVLGLASSADQQPVTEFLVKKAAFLEEWFRVLYSSLGETGTQVEAESSFAEFQKKHIISTAVRSLIEVYRSRNLTATSEKFEKLINTSIS